MQLSHYNLGMGVDTTKLKQPSHRRMVMLINRRNEDPDIEDDTQRTESERENNG